MDELTKLRLKVPTFNKRAGIGLCVVGLGLLGTVEYLSYQRTGKLCSPPFTSITTIGIGAGMAYGAEKERKQVLAPTRLYDGTIIVRNYTIS